MALSYRRYLFICTLTIVVIPITAFLVFLFPKFDTVYGYGFDKEHFEAFPEGGDTENVLLTFGPPLKISYWSKEGTDRLILTDPAKINDYLQSEQKSVEKQRWTYSKQGDSGADWYLTGFEFGPSGKVVKKYNDYITD